LFVHICIVTGDSIIKRGRAGDSIIKSGRTEIPSRGGGLRSHQEGRTEIPLTHLTLPHFCAWIYKDIFVYISIAVGDPVIIRG
jgi:hypothetical protein